MKVIENPHRSFCRDVAESCPWATFFHSPIWHDIVVAVEPDLKSTPLGFELDDGTKGYLPLLEKPSEGKGLIRRYESTHQGCYGGIVADGEVGPEIQAEVLDEVTGVNIDKISLTGNPLTDWTVEAPGFELEDDFTHIIELDKSFEDILSDFSRGHRSSMNKAEREGVEVRSSREVEDFERYFKAYQASLERWGEDASSNYPWEFFEAVQQFAEEYPDNIRLWLAEYEGELASGALVFYWNRHVDYWHGAAYKKHFDRRPNNLLHPEIIEHALGIEDEDGEQQIQYYDFNPSGGHEGVASFKSRFGADKVEFKRATYRNQVADAVGNFVSLVGGGD